LQIQPRHFSLLSVFLLGTFVVAIIGLYALPADSYERTIVARGAGVIVALTMLLSILRMPAELRLVWFFFWLYLAATVTADLIIFYQEKAQDAAPGPGLADAVYLSSYGFAFAGLARLARRSTFRHQVDVAIDAAIIGLAVQAVVYSLIVGPLIAQAETVNLSLMVAITYPVLDIFVLAALVRVLVLSNQRNPAILLLSAALLAFMLIDLTLSYTSVHGTSFDIEPPWLSALAMIALAASLPSAGSPNTRDGGRRAPHAVAGDSCGSGRPAAARAGGGGSVGRTRHSCLLDDRHRHGRDGAGPVQVLPAREHGSDAAR
jgi:hypothetical protein